MHDVCHPRDEMARDGARPTAIELATAVIYAHALLGWICNLVLRVVTVPSPRFFVYAREVGTTLEVTTCDWSFP